MKQLFFALLALLILNSTYAQVKATSAEINTGTDDAKFATALALQGSKYLDQNGAKLSAVTAAGANTYTASIAPAITAYSLGQVFYIKITTANTGASTLNLNGLGAKTLVKDANTALVAGDFLADKVYAVYYDGTNFQVLNLATNTNSQTLSLGAAAGNIVISGGNNISLGSISLKTETDANVIPTAPGIYGTINTTGSTNYPSLAGGGFTFVRGANLVGALQINQTNLNAAPLFRHGTGTTTWSNWETFASREWANAQFYNQTQTNTGFVKIGTIGGYAFSDPGVDLNAITTNNVFYIASSSTNKPTNAGGMILSFGRTSLYSSQMMIGNNADQLFFRSQNNGTWSGWYQGASREWATNNFAPISGGSYLPLTGGTLISALSPKLVLQKTASGQGNYIRFLDASGNNEGYVGLGGAADSHFDVVAAAGNDLRLGSNNTFRLTIGQTGITSSLPFNGTSATFSGDLNIAKPNAKLSFTGGDVLGEIGKIGFNILTNERASIVANRHTAVGQLTDLIFSTMGTERMRIKNGGNIDMTGALNGTSATFTGSVIGNGITIGINASGISSANPISFLNVSAAQRIYTGGILASNSYSDASLIPTNGIYSKGGITATSTITAKNALLVSENVAGDNNRGLLMRTGSLNRWFINTTATAESGTNAGSDFSIVRYNDAGVALGNALVISRNNGNAIFSGSIGIGTTNVHSYKLAVGGGIIAESVKVKPQGSWPDYVFEKDYPILPLNELELFVLKNKHLPDVPNATEVKKDGIELGEMNAKLLQKIEELTLYIIDQQKELKNLKTNEVRLSKAVEKLSAEMNFLKNK